MGAKGGKGGKGGYYEGGFGGKGGKGGFGIGFTTGYGSKGGKSYGGFETGGYYGGKGGKGGKGSYYEEGFAYGYAYTTEQNTANNAGFANGLINYGNQNTNKVIAGGYAVESSYEYTLPETSYSFSTTYQDNYVNNGQAEAAFMGSGRKTTQEEETVV